MFGFGKREIFTTLEIDKFSSVIAALKDKKIKYFTRVTSGAYAGRGRRVSVFESVYRTENRSLQYYVYVDKKDEQLARKVANDALMGL